MAERAMTMSKKANLCVGFIFTQDYDKVVMIHKNGGPYPGMLNGLGGHIEEKETAESAMSRETLEETNGIIHIAPEEWKSLPSINFPRGGPYLHSFYCSTHYDLRVLRWLETSEGTLVLVDTESLMDTTSLIYTRPGIAGDGNVPWLLRLALLNEGIIE